MKGLKIKIKLEKLYFLQINKFVEFEYLRIFLNFKKFLSIIVLIFSLLNLDTETKTQQIQAKSVNKQNNPKTVVMNY